MNKLIKYAMISIGIFLILTVVSLLFPKSIYLSESSDCCDIAIPSSINDIGYTCGCLPPTEAKIYGLPFLMIANDTVASGNHIALGTEAFPSEYSTYKEIDAYPKRVVYPVGVLLNLASSSLVALGIWVLKNKKKFRRAKNPR